jgi:hypothetical protein
MHSTGHGSREGKQPGECCDEVISGSVISTSCFSSGAEMQEEAPSDLTGFSLCLLWSICFHKVGERGAFTKYSEVLSISTGGKTF